MNKEQENDTCWQRYVWLLLLAYILIYLIPLGIRPIMIPDEIRYAEIPREMIETGNWVSPHLNGLRYFEKPVLGYWSVALSMQLLGENAFAMRLPSALSAGLSALAIFLLLARFGQRKRTALTAAMVYLTMLGVFLIGNFNILDSGFSFLLTAAFTAFYFSHQATEAGKRYLYLVLMGLFCGAAFLSKGFLAFVLLGLVVIPYVIWQGRWRDLFTRGWVPAGVAVLTVLPWAIMIHIREPDYWHYFFWEEHIKRFASEDAQHGEPVWFYLAFLPLLAWPWIMQLFTALKGLAQKNDAVTIDSHLNRYVWLWFILPFLFFSTSHGKLPTYILPCLAPLAILISIGLERYLNDMKKRERAAVMFDAAAWFSAFAMTMIALAVILIQSGVIGKIVWADNEYWKWWLLCAALFAGSLFQVLSTRFSVVEKKLTAITISILPLMLVIHFALPLKTAYSKMPGNFLEANAYRVTDNTIVLSDDIMIHAVNWYFHRTDVYMTGAGESRHGLSFDDAKGRLVEGEELKKFIHDNLGKKPMVLVHHADADEKMKAVMPPEAIEKRWGLFVLWYIPEAGSSS